MPYSKKMVDADERILSRNEVDGLRTLRDSIMTDIRDLRRMEKAEQSVGNRGQSILRSLSKRALDENHYARKDALRSKIYAQQRTYLRERAEIERRIASVSDHAARLMLSLYYADLLTHKQAAARYDGITDAAVQQIIGRYFARALKGRDPP